RPNPYHLINPYLHHVARRSRASDGRPGPLVTAPARHPARGGSPAPDPPPTSPPAVHARRMVALDRSSRLGPDIRPGRAHRHATAPPRTGHRTIRLDPGGGSVRYSPSGPFATCLLRA